MALKTLLHKEKTNSIEDIINKGGRVVADIPKDQENEDDTVRIHLRFPRWLLKTLDEKVASHAGMTRSSYIRITIQKVLEE